MSTAGLEIRVPFPFCKVLSTMRGDKTYYRWKAGARCEDGDCDWVADGTGEMILREVGRYTPQGFGPRVFYTRQFVSPTGEVWGGPKPKLRVMGAAGFTRLCKGYRYPVELVDHLANVEMEPDVWTDMEDWADAASY